MFTLLFEYQHLIGIFCFKCISNFRMCWFNLITQWAKSPKNNLLKECVFFHSALKIQCHVVKNTPLQFEKSEVFSRKSAFVDSISS